VSSKWEVRKERTLPRKIWDEKEIREIAEGVEGI
jgi:hypothetical protein